MKKAEFMEALAKKLDKAGVELTKKDLDIVLKTVFEVIGDVIKKGASILIPGFGTFKQGKRSARTGRNPLTGETLKIKAKKVAQFKAATALKDKVK